MFTSNQIAQKSLNKIHGWQETLLHQNYEILAKNMNIRCQYFSLYLFIDTKKQKFSDQLI